MEGSCDYVCWKSKEKGGTKTQLKLVRRIELCFFKKPLAMKVTIVLALIALCVSAELPHKYMALRGFDIEGNVIKQTGNKNVIVCC